LDSQLAKTQEALINAETGIQACVNLGPEFKQIAIEYSQLKKDIEARNWALQELQLAATRQWPDSVKTADLKLFFQYSSKLS